MIAVRLVRLIERHSDELTDALLLKFQTSSRTSDLRKVPVQELRNRSYEILRNLSDWLLSKSDSDVERLKEGFGYTPEYTTRSALQDFAVGRRLRQVVSPERVERWEREVYAFLRRKGQERFERART